MYEDMKEYFLAKVAGAKGFSPCGRNKWIVAGYVIHVRFRSNPKSGGSYSYNINKNTLSADFELWICNQDLVHYLIPIDVMKKIYEHPAAYVDYHYPDRRVAEVNTETHRLLYGVGALSMDFSEYFNSNLANATRGRSRAIGIHR